MLVFSIWFIGVVVLGGDFMLKSNQSLFAVGEAVSNGNVDLQKFVINKVKMILKLKLSKNRKYATFTCY